MSSNDKPRRRGGKRTAVVLVLATALGLGWYLRDCLSLGLGPGLGGLLDPGAGLDEQSGEPPTEPAAPGQPPGDAPASPPPPCVLHLDAEGLTLDGQPASIEEAVSACGKPGKARLRATGDARAGTYDELLRALDQAGVSVDPH